MRLGIINTTLAGPRRLRLVVMEGVEKRHPVAEGAVVVVAEGQAGAHVCAGNKNARHKPTKGEFAG